MRRSLVIGLIFIVLAGAGGMAGTIIAGYSPELGLDLQGGASVVLQPKRKVSSGVLNQSIEIIRDRVDALGVAEPDISRQGDAIIVQLPGVKDQKRALEIVGQTAELRFRPVSQTLPPFDPKAKDKSSPAAIPTTPREQDLANQPVILPSDDGAGRFQLAPAPVTGRAVSSANPALDPTSGQWRVEVNFNKQGSTDFDNLAAANVNKQVAIVLDGRVQSAPVIQQANFGGKAEITGDFSEREARDLALVLKYGSLPVELEQQSVEQVSASLGKDSLRAGIISGLLGLGLVLIYIIAYYRALGLVVVIGLTLSASLLWSIASFFAEKYGLALSLAGATGIVVSVGVTVDSYVVYFERLKDEVRSGKTVRSSVEKGFNSAFRTIRTADISSLIGALLLYFLTVGPVRGFAFFLGLSTLLDLIVAYLFTRPMVIWLGRNRLFTEMRGLGVARGSASRNLASEGAG